ncbi:NPC1 (predicted) [Pycnogonum litorale]
MDLRLTATIIILILTSEMPQIEADYRCVMYDTDRNSNGQPFVYDGPPKLLNKTGDLDIIRELCPHLYKGDEDTWTCCSTQQLLDFSNNTSIFVEPQIGKCPTCYRNFNMAFCDMTCAPDQSRFMVVTEKKLNPFVRKDMVAKLKYFMSPWYANNVIRSCRSVQSTSVGDHILPPLCGSTDSDDCTPTMLYKTASANASFRFEVVLTDKATTFNGSTFLPMVESTLACSDTVDGRQCPKKDCINTDPITSTEKTTESPPKTQSHGTRCVMYDTTPLNNQKPFVYDGPPKLLTKKKDLDTLKRLCPHLYKGENSTATCCSSQQLMDFLDSIELLLEPMLGKCPTCFMNFNKAFCDMTCSPEQSKFLSVTQQKPDPFRHGFVVTRLNYFMSPWYADNVIRSCRSVQSSSLGDFILPTLCGSNTVAECTSAKLYKTSSDNSPFHIKVIFGHEPITYNGTVYVPMSESTLPCSGQVDGRTCPKRDCINTDPITSTEKTTESPPTTQSHGTRCVMYDTTPDNNQKPFVYDGPPKLLTKKKDLDTLKRLCPHLYKGENSTATCCSSQQLMDFLGSIELLLEPMLGKCPTCFMNFNKAFCDMTCSPEQSKFLSVTQQKPNPFGHGFMVTSLNYFMSPWYADNVIRSCRSVQSSSLGDFILPTLCGSNTVAECTSAKLYKTSSDNSPFHIKVIFGHEPITYNGTVYVPMSESTLPCSGQVDGKTCPKRDCKDTDPITTTTKKTTNVAATTDASRMSSKSATSVNTVATTISTSTNKKSFLSAFVQNWWSRKDPIELTAVFISLSGFVLSVIFLILTFLSDRKAKKEFSSTKEMRISPEMVSGYEKFRARVEKSLRKSFQRWGTFCARYPFITLLCGAVLCGGLSFGMYMFKVTTDPVELWAAPQSRSRQERDYFNQHFQPFYRTEQLIIETKQKSEFIAANLGNQSVSSIFERGVLKQILDLQTSIENLVGDYKGSNITLKDVCFQPLKNECMVQSSLGYFQDDETKLMQDDYLENMQSCAQAYKGTIKCFGKYGGPIQPEVVFGGFPNKEYMKSEALVITFVNNNSINKTEVERAKAWEKVFIQFLKNYKNENLTISFNSERSIEDELDRSSKGDVFTILISYCVMFTYISLALGQPNSFKFLLVDSKMTLGLAGISIVMISVITSVGIFSYIGVPATLIIVEVIPFLVLAIGVDNIFIMVQALQRDHRRTHEDLEMQIGRVVGEVGPSMLLSSVSEACCFFLGALSNMPAVRVFAMYAGTALLVDFLLQISCFISLLKLDMKRQRDNRVDIACCWKIKSYRKDKKQDGLLYKIFKNVYAPILMNNFVRAFVIFIFIGWFSSSLFAAPRVHVGLDQELALPEDSYVVKYFSSMKKYLSIGPPVYFVIEEGFKYDVEYNQNLLCASVDNACLDDSFSNQLIEASSKDNRAKTYLQPAYYSWINNYIIFMRTRACCLYHKNDYTFCSTKEGLTDSGKMTGKCASCAFQRNGNTLLRPVGDTFHEYLSFFKKQAPSKMCAAGGKASYNYYIETKPYKNRKGKDGRTLEYPAATMFMLYHTVLKTSDDYTEALRSAWNLADKLTDYLHKHDNDTSPSYRVFAYSIFYVFYEQYLTSWPDTLRALVISVSTVFIVLFILSGFDLHSSSIILLTITLILVNLFGLMYWWNISLNAVALVNLIMAVGISVEFCSHITRAFASSIQPTRVLRAKEALVNIGSSVLSGITLTKFGGIFVLAFANSRIFQVYYFRLYLCIVLFGAAHGLILLPVILSAIGPPVNKKKLLEEQERQKRGSRPHQATYTPQSEL